MSATEHIINILKTDVHLLSTDDLDMIRNKIAYYKEDEKNLILPEWISIREDSVSKDREPNLFFYDIFKIAQKHKEIDMFDNYIDIASKLFSHISITDQIKIWILANAIKKDTKEIKLKKIQKLGIKITADWQEIRAKQPVETKPSEPKDMPKMGGKVCFKSDVEDEWNCEPKQIKEMLFIGFNEIYKIIDNKTTENLLIIYEWYSNERKKFVKELETRILINVEFGKVKGKNTTQFVPDRSVFKITLENKYGISIIDIFNLIKTTKNVPYIVVKADELSYYKIDKNMIPFDEWIESVDDVMNKEIENNVTNSMILMKLFSSTISKKTINISMYTDVYIFRNDQNINIIAQTITNQGINSSQTIDRINEVYTESLKEYMGEIDKRNDSIIEQISIAGTFLIPNQNISVDVFSDFVMNDMIGSMFLKIDENLKIQKKKSQIYIYYNDPMSDTPDTNIVTANITNQIVEIRDTIIKTLVTIEENVNFPVDSEYIRIRITKAKNEETVNAFIKVFAKLIEYFDMQKKSIIEYYSKYIQNFGNPEKKATKIAKKMWLKDIDPDLFGPDANWTRQCEKDREPRIVSEDEAKEIDSAGKFQTMKYPKPNTIVNGQPVTERYYVCDKNVESGHIFPGVKENTEEKHAQKYPYLPCCFKTSQKCKKKWNTYFKGAEQNDGQQDVGQNRVIQGNKFLYNGQEGELPTDISKLLLSYRDTKFFRKGVSVVKNPNSFIECVAHIFDKEYLELTNDTEKSGYIIAKRQMFTKENMYSILQENYEYTIDEIYNNINRMDTYFDPRRYVSLLEDEYQCNIILFSRDELSGTFTLPNHTSNFLYWNKKYKTTIMIFEHLGSEDTDAIYPHCEIIIEKNADLIKSSWNNSTDMYKELLQLNSTMKTGYYLSMQIGGIEVYEWLHEYVVKNPMERFINEFAITGQVVDNYGKTRIINCIYNDIPISILTSPLPNLNVPINSFTNSQYRAPISIINELITQLRLTVRKKIKEFNSEQCVEIHTARNNTVFIFGVDTSDNDTQKYNNIDAPDVRTSYNQEFIYQDNSTPIFDQFNYFKNYANILKQYNYWLFSKFCNKNSYYIVNLRNYPHHFNIFDKYVAENFVIIDKPYVYKHTSNFFSRDSGIFQDGKLVIHGKTPENSKEIIHRFIYLLQLQIINQPQYINGKINQDSIEYYHTKKFIPNIYNSSSDFVKYDDEIIFSNTNTIQKWIESISEKILMSKNIIPDPCNTYLLDSKQITASSNIVLCHTENKLWKAYNAAKIWYSKHYNPSDVQIENDLENINKFIFIQIKANQINHYYYDMKTCTKELLSNYRFSKTIPIEIVGYLYNSEPRFCALLRL